MSEKHRVMILEDHARKRCSLLEKIAQSPFSDELVVESASNIAQLAQEIEAKGAPDILFADIVMDDEEMNGIDAVRTILPSDGTTQVIYVTGYAEYCVSVYETKHVYFLLKPVDQLVLNKAIGQAIENLRSRKRNVLSVTYKNSTTLIAMDEIECVESRLRKVEIHTCDDSYEMYSTLTELEDKMPSCFVRTHKSFLVNLDAIACLEAKEVILRSGRVVPVGQCYKADFREAVTRYFGQDMP